MAGQNAEKMFRPHIACLECLMQNGERQLRINIMKWQPCHWFTLPLLHPISSLRKGML
jgi:hypothetical protein